MASGYGHWPSEDSDQMGRQEVFSAHHTQPHVKIWHIGTVLGIEEGAWSQIQVQE